MLVIKKLNWRISLRGQVQPIVISVVPHHMIVSDYVSPSEGIIQ